MCSGPQGPASTSSMWSPDISQNQLPGCSNWEGGLGVINITHEETKNQKLYQIQLVNIIGTLVGAPACNVLGTCSGDMSCIGKLQTVTLIAVFPPEVNLSTEILQQGIKLPSVGCLSNSNRSIHHNSLDWCGPENHERRGTVRWRFGSPQTHLGNRCGLRGQWMGSGKN